MRIGAFPHRLIPDPDAGINVYTDYVDYAHWLDSDVRTPQVKRVTHVKKWDNDRLVMRRVAERFPEYWEWLPEL